MRPITIQQTVTRIKTNDETYSFSFKEFIDGFKNADTELKKELVKEPELLGQFEQLPFIDVLIAGMVENLCYLDGIEAPEWVKNEDRYLAEPLYTSQNPTVQEIYFAETPIFYRARNLFCGKIITHFYNA